MLRIIQSKSVGAAKSYYTSGLSKESYYSEGQELPGVWRGKGAERLGLKGEVGREAFDALCDNLHPATGERLTARTDARRTVGYDLNFHAPKSVSAALLVAGDKRILDAFREAVRETMADIETDMQTRVRKGGKTEENRRTGEMVWGEFIHFTARPAKSTGQPDPHLHAHCFAFGTFDKIENQWKAGQYRDIKRDAPFYEACFHSNLQTRLKELGYGITPTAKGWEIAGIPQTVMDKFSNRTREIEAEAKARGITDAKAKDQLGAQTRAGKNKGAGLHQLWPEWAGRLTPAEARALKDAKDGGGSGGALPISSDKTAVDYALAHVFEGSSVATQREVMTVALRHGVGSATVAGVKKEMARADVLTREREGRKYITTKAVLAEEKAMIETVKRGRGQCMPLGRQSFQFQEEKLNTEQRAAVMHVLRSRDAVTGIRGGAGTGKTTLMREAVRGIEEGGKRVFTFAPTAEASRGVLRGEGFENADTVAALLTKPELQDKIRFQVIWVDEAGLLGAKTTAQLLKMAEQNTARVIFSGDIGQHTAVERGDSLRLLETKAGMKMAHVSEIQRQKGIYKQAVAAIAKGDLAGGFARLETMDAVMEMADDQRYQKLAGEYVQAVKAKKSVLCVSPTHAEGAKVTDAIRAELRTAKKLDDHERSFTRLESLQLTEAQRGDARNYKPGMVVQFNIAAIGFKRGARVTVTNVTPEGKVDVITPLGIRALPLKLAERFELYEKTTINIAKGEKLRITKNGLAVGDRKLRATEYGMRIRGSRYGARLDNKTVYEVAGFTTNGNIKLRNGLEVHHDYGHLAYGYCATSHGSQGKTVDRVLIAQSAASFRASSKEQFYVSVSRGRESVRIFTDDKQALRDAVADSSARMGATELVEQRPAFREKMREQTELVNRIARLAKIHAARTLEAVKREAKEKGRSWAARVKEPQKQREMEME